MQPEDSQTPQDQPQQGYYTPEPQIVDSAPPVESATVDPALEHETILWQAPEYVHRYKSPVWYGLFVLVVALLVAAAVFLMQSWTFALLIPVMAFALFAYSARPPRMMSYALSEKGLYINDTLHGFAEFKAFGVLHELDHFSLELIPVRRFRPSLSVYFDEASGEQIVDILGTRLPMQDVKPDGFDRIVRFLGL